MDNFTIIGEKIRDERRRKKISRERLAEMTNLSTYFIGQVERGQTKMSVNTLIKISECLDLSLDYMVKPQKIIPSTMNNLIEILNSCSDDEIDIIAKILDPILPRLRQYKNSN